MALLQAPNLAATQASAANIVPNINLLTNQGTEAQQRANYLEQQAMSTNLANQQTQMIMPLLQNGVTRAQQLMQGSAGAGQQQSNIQPSDEGRNLGISDALQPQGTTSQPAPQASAPTASAVQDSDKQLEQMENASTPWIQKHFAPPPMAMPKEIADQKAAFQAVAGIKPEMAGFATMVQTQWDNQQELAKQNAERNASLTARSFYEVMKSPNPRGTLDSIDHEDAQKLSPNMTDAQIKEYAQHMYRGIFPWTGRPATVQGGNFVDPATGEKISDARVSLTADQLSDIHQKNMGPRVPMYINGREQLVPPWYAAGYSSLHAADMGVAAASGGVQDQNGDPVAKGFTSTSAPKQSGPDQGPMGTNTLPPGFVKAAPNGPNGMVLGDVQGPNKVTVDLGMFKDAPRYDGSGRILDPKDYDDAIAAKGSIAGIAAAQKNLANRSNYTNSNMLQNLDSIQTGPGTKDANQFLGFMGAMRGMVTGDKTSTALEQFSHDNPAQYAKFNKWLSDEGLQTVGADVVSEGGTARFSAMLANIGMNSLSANVEMPKEAVRELLKYYKAGNMYNAQKWGADYQAALRTDKDMRYYDGAYGNARPIDTYLQGTLAHMDRNGNMQTRPTSASAAPQATPTAAPTQPNITEEGYNALKSGESYWWNGKQIPKK